VGVWQPKRWVSGNLGSRDRHGRGQLRRQRRLLGRPVGPVTFTIGAGTAAIALTSSAGSTDYGQSITFVANVAAGVAPSGTVTFLDGGTTLATVPLDGSGAATLLTNGSTPSLTLFDVAQLFVVRHPGTRTRWARVS
jgi:hypothetical protein